jgi:hypothetical protein
MKKKIICLTFAIFTLGILIGTDPIFAAQETSSMTCDNGVVNIGDDKSTVQDACGIPDSQTENEWVYNFGPSEPAYTVIFKEGQVVRILQDQWGS